MSDHGRRDGSNTENCGFVSRVHLLHRRRLRAARLDEMRLLHRSVCDEPERHSTAEHSRGRRDGREADDPHQSERRQQSLPSGGLLHLCRERIDEPHWSFALCMFVPETTIPQTHQLPNICPIPTSEIPPLSSTSNIVLLSGIAKTLSSVYV